MSGSDEMFYTVDGKKQDSGIHDPILSNSKAEKTNTLITARSAVERGMEKTMASRLYAVKESEL
tara:strand:- start:176 stop:367 length:192 start_codon:yes stop_codon:yes gene_type:complete